MKIPSSTFQKVELRFIKTDKFKSVFIKSMISHNPTFTNEPGQTKWKRASVRNTEFLVAEYYEINIRKPQAYSKSDQGARMHKTKQFSFAFKCLNFIYFLVFILQVTMITIVTR